MSQYVTDSDATKIVGTPPSQRQSANDDDAVTLSSGCVFRDLNVPMPFTPQTEKPHRIQRKRTKGWKMPPGAVYVGRPTRWGNPVPLEPTGQFDERGRAEYIATLTRSEVGAIRRELRGKVLACWCRLDRSCHADVLLEIANG